MNCAHKETLIQLANTLTREYSEAVSRLSSVPLQMGRDEWMLAWKLAERARQKSGEMLEALKQHRLEHGC